MKIDHTAPLTLPGEDDFLGYNIILAAAVMSAETNALLRANAQINMRQYVALRHLRAKPDLGSAELARYLFITPQSVGPLLDGLEQLGCVARIGGDLPGQKMAWRLTARGNAVLEYGDRLVAQLEENHCEQMGQAAVGTLNTLLKQLLWSLRGRAQADGD